MEENVTTQQNVKRSNVEGMRARFPKDLEVSKRVKKAWHEARNRKKHKSADGEHRVSMSHGLTLKVWAREEVANNGTHAAECAEWLKHKATRPVKVKKGPYVKNKKKA